MVYIGHMYVNKRIKLAQQGIALQKIYVLLFIIIMPVDFVRLEFSGNLVWMATDLARLMVASDHFWMVVNLTRFVRTEDHFQMIC